MKGTKDFPQCGFSNTVVQILKTLNVPFETFNILENEMLRQGLKEYSSWPTFPQLYIDGEFFGGCDITLGNILIQASFITFTPTYRNYVVLAAMCLLHISLHFRLKIAPSHVDSHFH